MQGQGLVTADKTVTPTTAAVDKISVFTYTITIRNEGTGIATLTEITDYPPPWFNYFGPTQGDITSDMPVILPEEDVNPCGDSGDQLTWSLSPGVDIEPQATKSLIFKAKGGNTGGGPPMLPAGIYYNQVRTRFIPWWGGDLVDIYTPFTAEVTVGIGSTTKCGFDLRAFVSQKLDRLEAVPGEETEFTYTLTIENVLPIDLEVWQIIDLLPPSLSPNPPKEGVGLAP